MKILHNLCLLFAREDGQDRKKQNENHETKVTKNQMTKIWDERNINLMSLNRDCTVISSAISEKIGTLVTLVDLAIVAFVLLASPKVSVGDVCTGIDFGGFY